jgi:hypothetical protein
VAALLVHQLDPVDADAVTHDGVRPLEAACQRNHAAVADLLLAHGVSSFVQPDLWLGLQFGRRLLRRQLPERIAAQQQQDAAQAAEVARVQAEADTEARRLEEQEAKAKKGSKVKPAPGAGKGGKKK